MSLLETIRSDVVAAMRAKDGVARDALRMVVATVQGREIDGDGPLDDAAVLAVVRTAVKTRTDSAEQFEAAGRSELAAKERREIEVLARYLPQLLDEEGTRALVARLVEQTGAQGAKDTGKVMKALMADHRGEVDGKLAQRIAAELLA